MIKPRAYFLIDERRKVNLEDVFRFRGPADFGHLHGFGISREKTRDGTGEIRGLVSGNCGLTALVEALTADFFENLTGVFLQNWDY